MKTQEFLVSSIKWDAPESKTAGIRKFIKVNVTCEGDTTIDDIRIAIKRHLSLVTGLIPRNFRIHTIIDTEDLT